MNDRTMIAAMLMQGMLTRSLPANSAVDGVASRAVAYADALIVALAVTALNAPLAVTALDELTETAHADEVGDWREYVRDDGKRALMHVAAGNLFYADDAFYWGLTPQGYDFWLAIAKGQASALTITRARDFARRVLAQMEADGE